MDVVPWADDAGFVNAEHTISNMEAMRTMSSVSGTLPAIELDDNLAAAVVIDFLEFADVACEDGMSA